MEAGVTNLYDVLDTVAKIGTGGLITGFATYFMMRKNHQLGGEKEKIAEKKNLLRECANKLELVSSMLNQLIVMSNSLLPGMGVEETESRKETIMKTSDLFNLAKEARTITFLLQEKSLTALVEEYLTELGKIIPYYRRFPLEIERGEIQPIIDKCAGIRTSILEKIGEIFGKL